MAIDPSRIQNLAARLSAELGVIILGVMIALWADGRVDDRRERQVETARLEALDRELTRTRQRLVEARADGEDVAEALRNLVSYTYAPVGDSMTLEAVRAGLLGVPELQPELSVYDDLRSSGELALFSDADLRQALSAMQARIERVTLYQTDLLTVQQLNVDPQLVRHFDLAVLMAPLVESNGYAPPGSGTLDISGDTEVRNLAIFKLDMVTQLLLRFDEVEAALMSAQELVRAQLAAQGS